MSDSLRRLNELIDETTTQYRKGDAVIAHKPKHGVEVTEIYAMPPLADLDPNEYEAVDVHFFVVGVNRAKAVLHREEIHACIRGIAEKLPVKLSDGPSYQHFGRLIEQERALHLFALGDFLAIWKMATPERIGIDGPLADQAARGGMIFAMDYKDA